MAVCACMGVTPISNNQCRDHLHARTRVALQLNLGPGGVARGGGIGVYALSPCVLLSLYEGPRGVKHA